MALIRWQPFREIETLRRQFDELFEELSGGRREYEMTWAPAVELQDTDDHLLLRAQIPGMEPKDLDIRVTRDAVYIAGEHRYENKVEEKGYFRSEFRYGKFERAIPLPVPVQNDRVGADYKNGILTLTLPKVQEAQRRVVRINLGESSGAIPGGEATPTLEAESEGVKQHAPDVSQTEATPASEPAPTS
ncbi:Hsp20/alpha crystallin family protein [Kamptonema formosum]|uniref:Hsp20/alpha crystallin family protein n=1 Tax=Kamptonema formosum TaxID=331992 RepID=UPI0003468C70|nr:Hsp20/alpha crystallin family protein [Oscillatoria sp. PCC 10802]